jgi:hypothetical protein
MSTHAPERPRGESLDRAASSNDPYLPLVHQVADLLGETEFVPFSQIYTIVRVLGRERVLKLLQKTLQIEQAGGLLTCDGTARRTTGGVFFFLAKGRYKKVWARERARASGDQLQPATSAESPVDYAADNVKV